MTHHPGPAPGSFFVRIFSKFRGLFLCVLFRTFAVFFCVTFCAVSAFFILALFCSFGLFWVAFCGSFAAFFVLFFALFAGPSGKITTGSQSRKQGGTERRSFFMSVFVAFWAPGSTRKAAQTEAGAAPDPSPCSCTHFQFFPVPLLCHFCAAMAAHSYPQQHTRSNEKPRYQAVFG